MAHYLFVYDFGSLLSGRGAGVVGARLSPSDRKIFESTR